jgi:hypothetical protein
MSDTDRDLRPYSLSVEPHHRDQGHWAWTIRKDGKVFQRSDRPQPSHHKAERDGLKAIEQLLRGSDWGDP